MTRLFTDGAEFGDVLSWDYVSGSTIYATGTPTPPTGSYCYKIAEGKHAIKYFPDDYTEAYYRARFYCTDLEHGGDVVSSPMCLYSDGAHVGRIGCVNFHLIAYNDSGTLMTGSSVLAISTWYALEVYWKIAPDPYGRIIAKINGVVEIDFTGDTSVSGARTTFNNLMVASAKWLSGGNNTYMDDIGLNSTDGLVDNSWLGEGRVELLRINAEGDTLQWLLSTGTTHYTLVDEIPPNYDSDYIYSPSGNRKDMFNLNAFTDTNKIVDRIWVEARARDPQGETHRIRLGYKSGGVLYVPSDSYQLPYGYTGVSGPYSMTDPATGLPWAKTALDALQVVVESVDIGEIKSAYTNGV